MATAVEPPITSMAFSPDTQTIVVGSQVGVEVYTWPMLTLQRRIEVAARNIHDLEFSPSGSQLAVGSGTPAEEGVVELFSWPDGQAVKSLTGHKDSVMAVAWRDGSSLVSASLDRSITVWDTRAGSITRVLEGHSRGVSSVCFLKDRRILVSAGIDRSLRVWNAEISAQPTAAQSLLHSLDNHTRRVHALALRPGVGGMPMVASASKDRTVRLWQPTIGRMLRFVRLEAEPLDIEWVPDGSKIVAACSDGHVRVIDPDAVKVTLDLPTIDSWAYALAVHPTDGSVAVGGRHGQVRRVVLAVR